MCASIVDWVTQNLTLLIVVGSGIFGVMKYIDQRKRELNEQRFEQYWKLVEVSQETTFVAKQKVALLLMKRYPEYAGETTQFLQAAKSQGGGWVNQNLKQIDDVLGYLHDTQ